MSNIYPDIVYKTLTDRKCDRRSMTTHPAFTTALETRIRSANLPPVQTLWGTVREASGQSVHIDGISKIATLGDLVHIYGRKGEKLTGEIISLSDSTAIAMMFGDPVGITIGQKAILAKDLAPRPSENWIGHVLDYEGADIQGHKPATGLIDMPLKGLPPKAIHRKALGPRLDTGVTALDTFLPLCSGQRVGLFAGSGVGKSTLLAALAKNSNADINVIALIGERGREVRTFVEKTLGPEGIKKSIVFVATSNDPSAIKLRTAHLAMATAEYFRDQGQQVLFLFDSLTRYAEAHRDVALTAGEVPSLRAYPPSTFRALAALCERAGPGLDDSGDITAVMSVLVAGSDMEEPIADMIRGILDGHIILDRSIAERGRYPAIDIRRSISRSLPEAASEDENLMISLGRKLIEKYEEARPLIQAGLYAPGADPELDIAIKTYPELDQFISIVGQAKAAEAFETLKIVLGVPTDPSEAIEGALETEPQTDAA